MNTHLLGVAHDFHKGAPLFVDVLLDAVWIEVLYAREEEGGDAFPVALDTRQLVHVGLEGTGVGGEVF